MKIIHVSDGWQDNNGAAVIARRIAAEQKAEGNEVSLRRWVSALSENFGLVVAEALEHGRHVIVTDGAPAWKGQPGVVYVLGYRDGTDVERVKLFRDGILYMRNMMTGS